VFITACHWTLYWAQSIQTIPSHPSSFKTYFYIMLQSTYELSQWCSSSRFPDKTLYVFPPCPHACNISCQFHIWVDHPNNTGQAAKTVKLLSMQFSPPPAKSFLLGSNTFLSIIFLKMSSLSSSLNVRHELSHLWPTSDKIIVLFFFILCFHDGKCEDEILLTGYKS